MSYASYLYALWFIRASKTEAQGFDSREDELDQLVYDQYMKAERFDA